MLILDYFNRALNNWAQEFQLSSVIVWVKVVPKRNVVNDVDKWLCKANRFESTIRTGKIVLKKT